MPIPTLPPVVNTTVAALESELLGTNNNLFPPALKPLPYWPIFQYPPPVFGF